MFKLTKITDPRCIEFYQTAFPNFSSDAQERLRTNWISKYVKKN